MKKQKISFLRLLFPSIWLIFALSLFSIAALIIVFTKGMQQHPAAYAAYVISAYTLTVDCLFFIKKFPPIFKKLKQRFYDHPYGNKYMTDIGYRTRVSLYLALGINLLYSGFKLISGVIFSSLWLVAVAVYYVILSIIRFLLLRYMKNQTKQPDIASEFRRYQLCGILMLFLNLTLTGVVLHMIFHITEYASNEILIITAAVYTFYTVTVSMIDIVKYRKHQSPVISASKAIRFAAALVSLLSLETSMLSQYASDENFARLMTALTGAGIFLVLLALSVYMVVHAQKELKKINIEGNKRLNG